MSQSFTARTGEDTPRIDIRVNETTDTIGNSRRELKFKTCPSLNFAIDIMTQRVNIGQEKYCKVYRRIKWLEQE